MGDISCELCGWTHAKNTGNLGLFKIISESSVAAGVRRIEGTTGRGVLEMIKGDKNLIFETAKILKANNPGDIAKRAEILMQDSKEQKREIENLTAKISMQKLDGLRKKIINIKNIKFVSEKFDDISAEGVKMLLGELTAGDQNIAAIIASTAGDKLIFTASCGSEAVKFGANAGSLVKQTAQIAGGSGGGRPEFAAAGGKDIKKTDEALEKSREILESMLKL
jgi:alanyl-tRNA synthetase